MSIDTTKPVSSLYYNDTELILQSSGGTDTSLGITGATVGQVAKITAMDDTGKPTSWEPVNMTGSDAEWEVVADIITESEDVTYYRYNVTDKTECYVMVSLTPLADSTSTTNGNIGINGVGSPWSNNQGITIMNNIQSVKTASKGMTYITSGKIVAGKWWPCILLASGNADGSWNVVQPKGMMALKSDSITNVSSLPDVDKITSIAVGSYTKFFGVGSHIYIIAR